MNTLIIYGTTEAKTRKIVGFMADRIRERGNQVRLIDSTDPPKGLDASCADRLMKATECKPTVNHFVTGAIRHRRYDFCKSRILRIVASNKGASTDTNNDHEFIGRQDRKAIVVQVAEHRGSGRRAFRETHILCRRIRAVRSEQNCCRALKLTDSKRKDGQMAQKMMPETSSATYWQETYMSTAVALGASWCDFVGERFHAYAHVIDDVAHCHDLNEAWKVQANFGQQTFKACSDQAAKVSGLVMGAAKGNGGDAKH